MINTFNRFASALALAGMATSVAAQPHYALKETSADRPTSEAFMFSGATVRLSLDGRGERRPTVALRVASGLHAAGTVPRIGEGIAFSAVPGAKPQLSLAGQDSKALARQLKMSEGGKTALIVGGVAVLALGALFVIGANEAVDDINDSGGCC